MSSLTNIDEKALIPSDVPNLMFLRRGLLVNTDIKAFDEYKIKKSLETARMSEVVALKQRINSVEDKLDMILELLKGK
jgi:hypothetical protein